MATSSKLQQTTIHMQGRRPFSKRQSVGIDQRPLLTKHTISVICPPATGAEAVSCYVLHHRVDGRCSLGGERRSADGHREREFRCPRLQPGVCPHDMTTRPRAASSPPDATGRIDGFLRDSPSVVRNDSRASHARMVRAPTHRPSPVAFSIGVIAFAGGGVRTSPFYPSPHQGRG